MKIYEIDLIDDCELEITKEEAIEKLLFNYLYGGELELTNLVTMLYKTLNDEQLKLILESDDYPRYRVED